VPLPFVTALVNLVPGIVKKGLGILEGRLPAKMPEADKFQLQFAMEQAFREGIQESEDNFRDFVIEHTGAAKDMPRFIQVTRGLVRPLITFGVFGLDTYVVWYRLTHVISVERLEQYNQDLKLLFAMTLIVLTFWFGEKMITRTGLVQVLMGRKNNKAESK